ncbi:MAG: mucoidy inhibitor MuiA family protein [Galbibacter orientalis]|uniref:mucoidy inhibitor MuiA family protein n=1 Tax=Galbibacter orientalis TaxID=453852 RepID=UPI0030032ABA
MIKKITLFFILLINITTAQNIIQKEIDTDVSSATVFLDGAQIIRNKSIYLEKGTYEIKFQNLSPYVEEKSINMGAIGEKLTILSVNLQKSFTEEYKNPTNIVKLKIALEKLESKRILEQTYLDVVHEDIAFLKENRNLNGKNEALSVSNLKEASNFFNSRLTNLKLKEIEHYKTINELNNDINNTKKQINEFSKENNFDLSDIIVKIENKEASNIQFNLSYLVKNAGWYPTYDLKASSTKTPIQIVYKANVHQDTKVDWKNVKLAFSSSNPNTSAIPPKLKTYYLDYNLPPPSYNQTINEVSGLILDEENSPLPGAYVILQGTTIGTTTNFDGKYSLSVPNENQNLEISYIGYLTKIVPVNSSNINIKMEPESASLDEVVVVGYGKKQSEASNKDIINQLSGKVAGISTNNTMPKTFTKRNQSTTFNIDTPYSIPSNNKNNIVEMINNEIPANFHYFSIPKVEESAFLIAEITDWEKYNLLNGEANIFFENTFVGKTILELDSQNDTLSISFGKDQNINIKRERNRNLKSKTFFGGDKEELIGWTTIIKNNKNESLNLTIIDQVPITQRKEIEVTVEKTSNGKLDTQTGDVKWLLNIKPNKTEKLDLQYSVKYPKSNNIYIE